MFTFDRARRARQRARALIISMRARLGQCGAQFYHYQEYINDTLDEDLCAQLITSMSTGSSPGPSTSRHRPPLVGALASTGLQVVKSTTWKSSQDLLAAGKRKSPKKRPLRCPHCGLTSFKSGQGELLAVIDGAGTVKLLGTQEKPQTATSTNNSYTALELPTLDLALHARTCGRKRLAPSSRLAVIMHIRRLQDEEERKRKRREEEEEERKRQLLLSEADKEQLAKEKKERAKTLQERAKELANMKAMRLEDQRSMSLRDDTRRRAQKEEEERRCRLEKQLRTEVRLCCS